MDSSLPSLPSCRVVGPPDGSTVAEWLDWRTKGIGASDAAAIAGLSRWGSPMSVWLSKTRRGGETRPSPAMRWGNFLEEAVCRAFAEDRDAKVSRRGAWVETLDEAHPYLRASLDGLAEVDGELGVLEAKTTNGRDGAWDNGVPDAYQVQVQHQLLVTGLDRAWVAVLTGGSEFTVYDVERDELAIAAILDAEDRFWRKYVMTDTPPPADGSVPTNEALKDLYARSIPASVELDQEAVAMVVQLNEAREAKREAEAREVAAANRLMALLGSADQGTLGGMPLITWKESHPKRLDIERLRAELPDVAAQYMKEGVSRTLRIVRRTLDGE